MDRLSRFYKTWLRFAFIGVAVLGVLLGASAGNTVARYSGTAAGLLFLVLEVLIGKWLWKVFHADLNIQGLWNARTTYEGVTVPKDLHRKGIEVLDLPRTSRHEARFMQDCLNLAIEVSGGADFPRFCSLAAEMVKDKTGVQVRYAYMVEYNQDTHTGCPEDKAIGYEEMTVDKYEELSGCRTLFAAMGLWKAKPIRMSGRFWHCAREGGVAYRGTAEFWRDEATESTSESPHE